MLFGGTPEHPDGVKVDAAGRIYASTATGIHVPHAEAADFDDSGWRVLAPEQTMLRLANGRVCFNWYRIEGTIPERVGDFDPNGSTVVFEIVIDDYAEVWVNGELPLALGDMGGRVVGGFNAPTVSSSRATGGRASGSTSGSC